MCNRQTSCCRAAMPPPPPPLIPPASLSGYSTVMDHGQIAPGGIRITVPACSRVQSPASERFKEDQKCTAEVVQRRVTSGAFPETSSLFALVFAPMCTGFFGGYRWTKAVGFGYCSVLSCHGTSGVSFPGECPFRKHDSDRKFLVVHWWMDDDFWERGRERNE